MAHRNTSMWQHVLARALLVKTYKHVVTIAVSGWAWYVFSEYRLPVGWLLYLLPLMSLTLGIAGFVAFLQDLLGPDRHDMKLGPILSKVEWGMSAMVRVFVYSALFVFANAKLDTTPTVDQETVLRTIAGVRLDWTDRLPSLVSTIDSWRSPGDVIRLPLRASEERRLWGGQHIAVRTRAGYFEVPYVVAIERDEAYATREVLKLAPTATEAWKRLIRYYINHQRWDDVVHTGLEYARLYPNDHEYLLWVGTSLGFAQRYTESIQILNDLITRHPSYEVHQQLGWSLNWSGQSQRAAEVLERSIVLDPENFEAYYHLGYVYMDMAVNEKALVSFKEVLVRLPHFPEVQSKIAQLEPIVAREHTLLSKTKSRSRPTAPPLP